MAIIRKFIGLNAVDGERLRLDNAESLRARNATDAADIELLKLDSANKLQLVAHPFLPADPTDALQAATKQYVDAKSTAVFQERFVTKGGNDVTGDGSISKPYATLTAAFASITDAAPTKRYVVRVAAGNYSEAAIALPANVFVVGESKESVRITGSVSMGAWAQDNSGSDDRSGFSMVSLLSAANFNWTTAKSRAGKLYMNEVVFGSTVTLYGYDNAIAQAQFNSCIIFGAFTVSGINVGVHTNNLHYGTIALNQHPNGGMATILNAIGGTAPQVNLAASVNDFNRRCSLFAKEFWMDGLTVDGPSAYADMTTGSVPNEQAVSLNGGNLVYLNPVSPGGVQPDSNNARYIGDFGKQWFFNFAYVHASTGTELYLTSTAASFGPDSSGRSIFIQPDGYGLQTNVNGGDIVLETAAVTGTGVRGKVTISARELDAGSVKITNVADGVDPNDAVNVSQLAGAGASRKKESLTLSAGDILAQHIDLQHQAKAESLILSIDRVLLYEGEDYSLSTVGGKTRISFIPGGPIATGGGEALIAGDILRAQYQH